MAQPTTQLNATEQDTLVKQIGLALLRAAPRDWRRVTAAYRAVGRYHELTGEVVLEDGSAQEWMATHDIATLFGRLRAGMYREGRGTWFNARYQLDHPSSYNLEYDRDEPRWDLMPPPQAYADELRTFPRSEDNVPEWLMRRMAGLAPEQPGPRFRIARIFDGHEPSGRPVLNRPELDVDEQHKVLEYLNNAPVVRAERGFDLDRLAQQPAPTVPVAFHTDGVWIWPAAVNYYLQEYGVAPEAELVAHIAGAGHALPEVPEQTVQAAAGYLNRGAPPPRPPRGVPEQAPQPPAAEPVFEARQEEPEARPAVEQPTTFTPVIDPEAGPPTMLVQPVTDAEPEPEPRGDRPGWDDPAPKTPADETHATEETRTWDARDAFAGESPGGQDTRSWDGPEGAGFADEEPTEGRGWDGREAFAAQEAAQELPRGPESRGQRGFAGPEGQDWDAPEGRGGAGQAPAVPGGIASPVPGPDPRGPEVPGLASQAPAAGLDQRGQDRFAPENLSGQGRRGFTNQESPADLDSPGLGGPEPSDTRPAFDGQAARGGLPDPDGPPTMLARPVAPPSGPAEPALNDLRSRLSDLGVPDAAYRIGEPAEHGWSLEKVDDGWRVGWYDETLTSPAVFGDADDAAAFMLGKLLLNPGGRTAPPARPEMDATDVPRTPAQEPAEPQRHDLPHGTLSDRLDEPDPAAPPTMLAAPAVAPAPPAPPRREPPPRRVESAAAAPATASSGGGNQQWPIQPLPGEPPLTLFRGKEMRELPAGSELDRFGAPNGNLTYAAGTAFEERSLVPEWVNRPYHVYRVQRPLEALAGVAIPWFNQPGGGAAYLLPASIEDLLASGDLIELDPGEPPID